MTDAEIKLDEAKLTYRKAVEDYQRLIRIQNSGWGGTSPQEVSDARYKMEMAEDDLKLKQNIVDREKKP